METFRAFAVHVLTACGAALALLALIFATGGHWEAMFFCLGLALIVDGVDGPLAREFKVAQVLPRWSGDTLDLVVDFTTYVFVPAFAIVASGLMPDLLAIPAGVVVVVLLCSRAAVRRMSTAKGGQGGSIVLLSSMAAQIGGANEYVVYAAAKGAVDSLAVGLAREVAKEGVRVNAIRPGVINTDIHEPGRVERVAPLVPMGRAGEPDEVAAAILFLLSDEATYITGSVLNVSGGR